MSTEQLSAYVVEALQLALLLSLPALCASLVVGLVSSWLQAATQVQDPALSFVPRLFAVGLTLLASASLMRNGLVTFTAKLFAELAAKAP